jgi:hypothetical protein
MHLHHKSNRLMLFREISVFHCENNIERTNTPCGQKAEPVNIKGVYSNHCILKR